MITFIFTKKAEKAFRALSKQDQVRVSGKLTFLKTHDDIFSTLKSLTNFEPATHRLRIGSLRIILQCKSEVLFHVLDIGQRKDIYR